MLIVTDIISVVTTYLSYSDIIRLSVASRDVHRLCNSMYIWTMMMKRDYMHVKVRNACEQYRRQVMYKQKRMMFYHEMRNISEDIRAYNRPLLIPVEIEEYMYDIMCSNNACNTVDRAGMAMPCDSIIQSYNGNVRRIDRLLERFLTRIEGVSENKQCYMFAEYYQTIITRSTLYYKVTIYGESIVRLNLDRVTALTLLVRLESDKRLKHLYHHAYDIMHPIVYSTIIDDIK